MLYPVIIAGGSGKRLWPKSRKAKPKFFLKVEGNRTLLEDTLKRAKRLAPIKNILIITNKEHVSGIKKLLPKFPKGNIIAEPVSKNTAPAICLASLIAKKRNKNAVIAVMPADQIIENTKTTRGVFSLAQLAANIESAIVTIGIKPKYAATGYGYIKVNKPHKSLKSDSRYKLFSVDKFVEKPSFKKAKLFIKSKKYLWNSGIFIGKADVFLKEFKKHSPKVYKIAKKIDPAIGTSAQQSAINKYYGGFSNISIDYAVMEKIKKSFVVEADIDWQDVGSWDSFVKSIKKDSLDNSIIGNSLNIDLKNSIVITDNKHLVATIGLKDLIIVNTDDATLVCSKDRAEEVRNIVALAKRKSLERYI